MSKSQFLREFINQQLTVAANEIFELFERTITEYEEKLCRSMKENEQQQKLLEAVLNPELRLHRADVQHMLGCKERHSELQERGPRLDQGAQNPPQIKEEEGELWISQEREQLQGPEEVDAIKFTFIPASVKSEEDGENPQFSLLHQIQTEYMETGVDGEDCGEPDQPSSLDPESDNPEDSSEPGNEDSDYWDETRANESSISGIKNMKDRRSITCPECGKRFGTKEHLIRHKMIHSGEKPFGCTDCGQRFAQKSDLTRHMGNHSGEKLFSCSKCGKRFNRKSNLKLHMEHHREDKVFSCSECDKRYNDKRSLERHLLVHTGERPFICSVCSKSFKQQAHLNSHMMLHTGEKPFSCSECDKRFYRKGHLASHMLVHTGEKPFSCSECGKRFSFSYQLKKHKSLCS